MVFSHSAARTCVNPRSLSVERNRRCQGRDAVNPRPWDDPALFCTFLTTAWPEPCAVRSIRGEPASAGNRQSFASSIDPTFRKTCTIRGSGGLVSASRRPHTPRAVFRLGQCVGLRITAVSNQCIQRPRSPSLKGNTVELAVRYVRNRASNYSPLTKGGYRGVPGRGDPAGLGRKITPLPPLRKEGTNSQSPPRQ